MLPLIQIAPESGGSAGLPLPLPRIAWIELTSKCPVDCVFCSRKAVRGTGEHMSFELYTRLLRELERPLVLRLSYSGESGHYPRLIEALDAAKGTGAQVELVTALVSVPEKTVRAMAERLDRITLSIHATSDAEFRRIYRYGSFAEFDRRLKILGEVRLERGAPKLDFAFVAMESNLSSLDGVVELARERYVEDVFVQPVMRREPFEYGFPELDSGSRHLPAFAAALRDAVDVARSRCHGVRIQIANPRIEDSRERAGEKTAQIIGCPEDPWQTIHVMANGDVISCGWRQAYPLGNLASVSLREIWHGPDYQDFRKAHRDGSDQVCRQCSFRKTHAAEPLEPRLTPQNANLRQMPAGWFEHDVGDHGVWAGAQASIQLPASFPALHLRGALPPGPAGDRNVLVIHADGIEIATIENRSKSGMLEFDRVLRLPERSEAETPLAIGFATLHEFVPRNHGHNGDRRRLGFCLELAECVETGAGKPDAYAEPGLDAHCLRRLERLRKAVALSDALAGWIRPLARLRRRPALRTANPGLSILIPERDSPDMLEQCLHSVEAAGRQWSEPLQVIVVANGVRGETYAPLRVRHPAVDFVCEHEALTFCGAVREGLKRTRHDWVYLLNSDMILDPGALAALAAERHESVFALGSRIFLADTGSLSCETNWTAYRVAEGILEVFHASPPEGAGPFEVLFGGGGCTLYRRTLLERYIGRHDPYAPFYFEDLEWATLAWRDGFRSLLCPASITTHHRRATINRFYEPAEVARIFERNALQHQLRHVIENVSREAVLSRIAAAGPQSIHDLTAWRKTVSIALARLKSGTLGTGSLPVAYRACPK